LNSDVVIEQLNQCVRFTNDKTDFEPLVELVSLNEDDSYVFKNLMKKNTDSTNNLNSSNLSNNT